MSARLLSPESVDEAEAARAAGDHEAAIQIVTGQLSFVGGPEQLEIIAKIVQDPGQLAILAGLARIQVVASSSAASREIFPSQVVAHLQRAAHTIQAVYRNSEVRTALQGVTADYEQRLHHFLVEMTRDEAKVLAVAAILYPLDMAAVLERRGLELLEQLHESLPEDHPVKSLVHIEWQLMTAQQGNKIDALELTQNFQRLVETDIDTNPRRVATVAAWLAVYGDRMGLSLVYQAGLSHFMKLIEEHPDWAEMLDREYQKFGLIKRLRDAVVRMLVPRTVSSDKREHLFRDLLASP